MKKCCCIILAAFTALAFVTTTLASDVVMEFYLSNEASDIKPVKSVHCMLLDSDRNRILDERFNDETVCKLAVTLEEGDYSLIVEEPDSHYFGNMSVQISSESSSSMLFLLDNLGLRKFEGVHSCEHNLACVNAGECVCDDSCVCRQLHNKARLKFVGQTRESYVPSVSRPPLQSKVVPQRSYGQPTYSASYACSNLCGTGGTPCCPANYGSANCASGAWGLLGLLGLLALIDKPDPGPITDEPVYK